MQVYAILPELINWHAAPLARDNELLLSSSFGRTAETTPLRVN